MVLELGEVFGRAGLPNVLRLSTKRSAFVDPNAVLGPTRAETWVCRVASPLVWWSSRTPQTFDEGPVTFSRQLRQQQHRRPAARHAYGSSVALEFVNVSSFVKGLRLCESLAPQKVSS